MTVSDTHHEPGPVNGVVNGTARLTVVHEPPAPVTSAGVREPADLTNAGTAGDTRPPARHQHAPNATRLANPGAPAGEPGGPVDTSTGGLATDPTPEPGRRVRFTPASAIQIRPTYWLWDDRIPQGALVLGPGREGIGKSLFCAWLAAQITHGTLPGVHSGQPRSVVYAATEDSWERTIAGRLIVAGADMNRVYRVEVDTMNGVTLPLSLPRDCDDLATEIARADAALLVLDPLISAVDSRIDVNGEKLREALEPLAALADRTGCSIFGLAHFNKATGTDVLSRITGSRAFAAVARAVVAFAKDTTADDGSCVLSQVKNNLGRLDLPSLRYRVDSIELSTPEGPGQWGRLRFLGETTTHVDDLLNDTTDPAERAERNEVTAWLRDFLTAHNGAAPATDVIEHGEQAGYSKDKLKRAKKPLGIESTKDDMHGGWTWSLPRPQGSEEREGSKGAEPP